MWSSHDNTKLKANSFDIHAKIWLNSDRKRYRFATLLGLQNTRYQWVAPNYAYLEYDNINIYGFGDDPNRPVISYKQTFKIPYIGFLTGFSYKKFDFDAVFKLSKFGTIRAFDIHHSRNFSIRMTPVSRPIYSQINFNTVYRISNKLSLLDEFGYAYLPKTKGYGYMNTVDGNHYIGKMVQYNSLRNMSKNFSVGLKYNF